MSHLNVYGGAFGTQQTIRFPNRFIISDDNGNRFQLSQAIKGGGNGIVFSSHKLAENGSIEFECAVKFLTHYSETRYDRFCNEIRIMQQLRHPSIANLYAHGETDFGQVLPRRVAWAAMDMGGDNLRKYIDTNGAMAVEDVLRVGGDLCAAMQHVHSMQIIHRDLKPANIVWADSKMSGIYLIDFGIAKFIQEDMSARPLDDFTGVDEFVGPANWSSQELLQYARDKSTLVSYPSDYFQIGKIVWFLATNQITAGIPSLKRDPTNGKLHKLVCCLVADDPNDRPATIEEIKSALEGM